MAERARGWATARKRKQQQASGAPNEVLLRQPQAAEPVASSAEIYGRLKEGAHFAGYSFERACTHLEWLLEEGRWTLGGQYDDVNKFLKSIKLGDELRPAAEQRKRIAQRIKALQPAASQRAIAKVVGVDNSTIHRDLVANATQREVQAHEINGNEPLAVADATPPRIADVGGAAAAQMVGRVSATRGTLGTGEFEWYTPAEWVERAREVLGGIDLDPATSLAAQRTVKAARFHTLDDDGLGHEWHGRVWMNPPYSQPFIEQFAYKLVDEVEAGRVAAAIVLTNDCTDTRWFDRLMRAAKAITFPGRIRFVSPRGESAQPLQGQALFGYGDAAFVRRFKTVFSETGVVLPVPR